MHIDVKKAIFPCSLFIILVILIMILNRQNNVISFPISFLAVGDIGTGEDIQYKIAEQFKKKCQSNCQGIFLLGDVIYPQGVFSVSDEQFQTKFELPFQNIDKPIYIVLGNHDYQNCIDCMVSYSTVSAKWKLPDKYYKISLYPTVDVFVIDTNLFTQNQQSWLATNIERSHAIWKVILAHHPLYSHDNRHSEKENLFAKEIKNIICSKADVYISGHDHFLADLNYECGIRLIVSGGGGAPLGEPEQQNFPFISANYGFVEVVTTQKNIQIKYINLDGKTVYLWSTKK